MKISLTSLFVNDQEKALVFYTETLGFQVKHDVPMGPHRWLTLVSPQQPDGVELLLEPDAHPAVPPFQQALKTDEIPAASFEVDNLEAEHARLTEAGVTFTQAPIELGGVRIAVLDDGCGNLIQLMLRTASR